MKLKTIGAIIVAIGLISGGNGAEAYAQRGSTPGGNNNNINQSRQWSKPEPRLESPSQDSRDHSRSVRFTQETFGGYNNSNTNTSNTTPTQAKPAGERSYRYGNYMQDGKRRYR